VTFNGQPAVSAPLEVVSGTTTADGGLGAVTIDSGATLFQDGNVVSFGDVTVASGGLLDMNNSSFTFDGTTLTNNGAVISSVGFGVFNFNGQGGTGGTTQHLAGTGTYNTNGRVDFHVINSTTVVSAAGAIVEGIFNNTIDGGSTFTNNGTMAPGIPPGTANVSGNWQLGSTSSLDFEIGGIVQGTDYDDFNKIDSGALTLNGNLTLTLINNFIPQNSDTFTIVSTQAILQGAFNNVPSGGRLATTGGEGTFRVTYNVTNDPLLSRNVTLSDFQTANPCPAPTGTEVDGTGSIAVSGGSASFNFQVPPMTKGKKMRTVTHFFDYGDPVAGINFEAKKVTSLTITGNHAQFSGTAKLSHGHKVSWTVDVVDFNCPEMPDQFSIQMSNGYSASGPLTSGDISLH
jgi:hypothetical protein